MSTKPCPISEQLATSGGGALECSLHDHVAGCLSCQNSLLVAAALHAAAVDDAPLPDPRVLWLRASTEARAAAARRALRLIDVVQATAAALLALALALVALVIGPSVGALAGALARLLAAPTVDGFPLVAAVAAAALLLPPLAALADRVGR